MGEQFALLTHRAFQLKSGNYGTTVEWAYPTGPLHAFKDVFYYFLLNFATDLAQGGRGCRYAYPN